MEENKKWIPKEGYSLTLEEIDSLYEEFIHGHNFIDSTSLQGREVTNTIKTFHRWLVNAAISGSRLIN